MPTLLQWAGTIVAIIFVDLALSGDNAVVIGAVASRLRGRQRRWALIIGGGSAIVLRIGLTLFAVALLQIPYLRAIGGFVVLILAFLLLRDIYHADDEPAPGVRANARFVQAAFAIMVADLSMSIDNILAIAALAKGNYVLLIIGLLISILLLMFASAFIAHLIEKNPWLLYLAGGILAWTAGTLIVDDRAPNISTILRQLQAQVPSFSLSWLVPLVLLVIFSLWAVIWWLIHRRPTRQIAS